MNIKFAYVNPGGNPTALVLTKVKRLKQSKVAKQIMNKIPTCEQVGFIERAKNSKAMCRLQMMGGEFCGNALRCVAVWLTTIDKKADGKNTFKFLVESSGTNEIIEISAKTNSAGQVISAATHIPIQKKLPIIKRVIQLDKEKVLTTLVNLEGISFLLLPQRFYERVDFKKCFEKLCQSLNFNPKACGLIFYKQNSKANFSIKPIIYVKKTKTIIKETSCASGSVALLLGQKLKKAKIFQPSGFCLNVKCQRGKTILVDGKVGKIYFKNMLY